MRFKIRPNIWYLVVPLLLVASGFAGTRFGDFYLKESGKVLSIQTSPTPKPTRKPTSYQTPTPSPYRPPATPLPMVEVDPIVDCGPGLNSKQYVRARQSECINYTDCESPRGTWTFMKKSDCDKKQQENQAYTGSYDAEPLVDCVLSYGTFQLTQSNCELYRITDMPIPDAEAEWYQYQQQNPPVPTKSYAELNRECKRQVGDTYSAAQQRATQYGATSTREAVLEIAKKEADRAIAECDRMYP